MRRPFIAVLVLALSFPLFATEPNPSARQRELVERLLELTNANRIGLSMMDSFFEQIEKQFLASAEAKGNRPEDIAEAKEMFTAFRQKASQIDFSGLMNDSYVRIYSKYFTESDLESLIAFYSTPTGKKSIEVMPALAREGMEAGVREVSPKIEQVMAEVAAEQEKKRPWRRTMSDLRSVASALEGYAEDHDELYPAGDYESLKADLEPYISKFPEKDIWGHAYAYVVSPDRQHYRLVSAGADSIFDWDSRRIAVASGDGTTETPVRYRERLEDDVILADYEFVQLPVQAKPAQER
jgi:hypothetical protein